MFCVWQQIWQRVSLNWYIECYLPAGLKTHKWIQEINSFSGIMQWYSVHYITPYKTVPFDLFYCPTGVYIRWIKLCNYCIIYRFCKILSLSLAFAWSISTQVQDLPYIQNNRAKYTDIWWICSNSCVTLLTLLSMRSVFIFVTCNDHKSCFHWSCFCLLHLPRILWQ